jgi:hypothetical protein
MWQCLWDQKGKNSAKFTRFVGGDHGRLLGDPFVQAFGTQYSILVNVLAFASHEKTPGRSSGLHYVGTFSGI